MKNLLKAISGSILLSLAFAASGQSEMNLCEGTGVHCMEIIYGDISLKLVKGKSRPEIIIKPQKS